MSRLWRSSTIMLLSLASKVICQDCFRLTRGSSVKLKSRKAYRIECGYFSAFMGLKKQFKSRKSEVNAW